MHKCAALESRENERAVMQSYMVFGLIFIAGIINFIPLIGVISSSRLTRLYGLEFSDPTLELLMRHRAVLFGILGGFMMLAAFKADWQVLAIVMGGLSMTAFVGLAGMIPGSVKQMRGVILADIVGILCLVGAGVIMLK